MEEQESDITLLLEYLHLETGEEAGEEDTLKANDLVYVGEYVIDGILCKYWSYPTTGEPMWATIEDYSGLESYSGLQCIGMTATPPPQGRAS